MKKGYVIVGEFDDDETVVTPFVAFCEDKKKADILCERVNNIYEEIVRYEEKKSDLDSLLARGAPKFSPRRGNLTPDDQKTILLEKKVWKKFSKERKTALETFTEKHKPKYSGNDQLIYDIIMKIDPINRSGCWEGGFSVEEILCL